MNISDMLTLKDQGRTVREIALLSGLSTQRVYQILSKQGEVFSRKAKSQKQKRIIAEYMNSYFAEHGKYPTQRNIAEVVMHGGSYTYVNKLVQEIRAEGLLTALEQG